jgi:aminopeptidase YwaD
MAPASGSALVADPDVRWMTSVITRLAADDFAGRRIGTAGGRVAAEYLADRLRALGARASFDRFGVPTAVREVYATPRLALSGSGPLTFRRDFCEHLASADAPAMRSGPIVAIDAANADGAWVVDSAWSAERVSAAADAGAIGVLVPRGTDSAGWMPKMIVGPTPGPLPVLAVRTAIHDALARDRSVVAEAAVPLRTVDVSGANVIGVFRDGAVGATSLLLTAHFDGVGDDPDQRFPAACDNAAGVAAVMESARLLHRSLPSDVGLAVALLDGEEAGARGSANYARQVRHGTYVINLDGAAQLADAAHVEAGGPAEPLLLALDAAARQIGVRLLPRAMPSDNRRFAAAGIPAIGIGMGMPGYQTPMETPDRVDAETLDKAVRLVVATASSLVDGSIV